MEERAFHDTIETPRPAPSPAKPNRKQRRALKAVSRSKRAQEALRNRATGGRR